MEDVSVKCNNRYIVKFENDYGYERTLISYSQDIVEGIILALENSFINNVEKIKEDVCEYIQIEKDKLTSEDVICYYADNYGIYIKDVKVEPIK